MNIRSIVKKQLSVSWFLIFIFILSTSCDQDKNVYKNPILPGFNPDPSICRVEDDFYMVTNSSEYFPGIPVYHSKDLVNWELISHVLSRPSQLNLDSVDSSRGIFAPTIRYHEGMFYVLSTLTGTAPGQQGGNFISTAADPMGPWSEPYWLDEAMGIDPSLFFDDDGKAYYHGNYSPSPKKWDNHRVVWLQELDLKTMKLVGERKDILDGFDYYQKGDIDGGIPSGVDYLEAPHIYKKEGFYYLLLGHGGTFQNHAASIFRSKSIEGPYETNPQNPILTHRDLPSTHSLTSVGHADLVQADDGWWMVYLGRRPYGGKYHILGRETFLSPVDWEGEWPVVNPDGQVGRGELIHKKQGAAIQSEFPSCNVDEFNAKSLDPEWTFIRTPRSQWWSLSENPGFLRLTLRPERISEIANPSFLGKRQVFINGSVETKLNFKPQTDREEAGLAIIRDRWHYFTFTMGMENGKRILRVIEMSKNQEEEQVLAQVDFSSHTARLKVETEGVFYTFSYTVDDDNWSPILKKINGSFLGSDIAGRFTGTIIGLYASSNGLKTENYAEYDWFKCTVIE